MKAILIDVLNENVRMVEVDDKNVLKDWYKHIGCSMVEVAHYFNDRIRYQSINNRVDSIMVDEEGMFQMDNSSKFFSVVGGHQPFIGNGLVVGVDRNGNSCDPCISVEEVRSQVSFHTMSEIKMMVGLDD